MAWDCTYLTRTDRKKSALYEELKRLTNSEIVAEIEYNLIHSPEFISWFADTDWVKDYESKNHSIPSEILTENLEPKIFKNNKGYYFKNIKGELKYIAASKLSDFSSEDLTELVSDISYAFIQEYLTEHADIREAIKSINTDIKTFLRKYAKDKQSEHAEDTAEYKRIELILNEKNLEDLSQLIKDNFKRLNVELIEEVDEDNKTSGLNLKDSTTINSKDRASANIKLLIAFSPKVELKDGQYEIVSGKYLGGVLTEEFDLLWRLLEDNLAGIVPTLRYTYHEDGSYTTSFETMYNKFRDKLISMHEKHPSLLSVIASIEGKESDYIKHQFVQALFKSRLNMVDAVIQNNGDIRIMDSANNTVGKKLAALWAEQFVFQSSIVNPESNTINKNTIDTLYANFNSFVNEALNTNNFRTLYPRLLKFLNFIKITGLTEEMLDEMHDGTHKGFMNFLTSNTGSIRNLMNVVRDLTVDKVLDADGDSFNPFEKEHIFFDLADKYAESKPDASETTILTKDGRAWLFDLVNFTNLNIDMWKDGDIQELKERLELPYYRNSIWAKRIIQAVENDDRKFLDNLKTVYLNNFRKGNDVKDNKDITLEEQVVDSIVKMFLSTPMFNMLEPADKSRFMHIQGFDRIDPDIRYRRGTTDIDIHNPEVIEIFYNYFLDEYNRIIDEQGKESSVAFYSKNRGQFQLFETIAEKVKPLITVGGRYMVAISEKAEEAIRAAIKEDLLKKTLETTKEFEAMNIYEALPNSVNKEIGNSATPKEYLAGIFTINGMIANIEMTKLFTGDPAYYKNMTDFKKRVPATYTNGMMLDIQTVDELTFSAAVAYDVQVGSAYLSQDPAYVANVAAATGASEELVKSILSDYNKVERTDAQAYITPERWRFLLTRLGKFEGKEAVYQRIINGEPTAEDIKIAAQPLKGVYFSIVNGRPVYLKYSQSVLIPALVKGSQLQALADKMNGDPKKGQPKIDELIFLSGVKVGADKINTISDAEGNLQLPETLTTMQLDNRFWKLQQDLPTKGMKDMAIGSQIQKNIFADFDATLTYDYAGKPVTGNDLLDTIDKAFSTISDRNVKKLLKDLTDKNGEVDKRKLNNIILREVKRSGNDINLIEAIEKGLPYDAIPNFKQKIESILFSKITDAAVKVKTSGAAFIQMANFGLDKLTNKERAGIIWLKEGELKPPLIEDGKLKPGQVLIPSSLIAKYLPNYRSMTGAELKKKMDRELFELIGYRIPNQGMSSNDFLEVVGILPDTVGDTIVAYSEITAKTGSDFDIDKMYVMLPEMHVTYTNPNKLTNDFLNSVDSDAIRTALIEEEILKEDSDQTTFIMKLTDILTDENFETESESIEEIQEEFKKYIKENPAQVTKLKYVNHNGNSTKALNNRIFQGYKSILTHVNTYLPLVTSIDRGTQVVKRDIAILSLPLEVGYAVKWYDSTDTKNKNNPNYKILLEAHEKGLIDFDETKETIEIPQSTKRGLDHIDPLSELVSKKGLIEGKNGVGITANNLTDHPISQLYPLSINSDIGFGHVEDGSTLLSKTHDVNGNRKITDIISAFLNAFVDIAKDPYILRGNYNDFTTNTAFLLLRAGATVEHVNRFIGQPVLVEYAKAKSREQSSVTPSFKVDGKDARAKKYMLNKYGKNITSDYRASIDAMSLSQLYQDYLDPKTLEKNLKNPDPVTQYAILKYFLDLQPVVSGLQNIVKATKSDVTGATSTAAERQVFEQNYNEALRDSNFNGVRERFEGTRFGTFYKNSIELAGRLASQLFLTESKSIRDSKMQILSDLNPQLTNNADAIKLINSEYYAFLMAGTAYASRDVKTLIKEVPKKIMKYREELSNYLLDNLVVKQFNGKQIATANPSGDYEHNMMYTGWLELFRSKDVNVRMFARELVQYAYHTSGFKHGIGRFFSSIPHEWVGWEYIDEHMKHMNRELNKDDALVATFQETFARQFAQHNVEKEFNKNPLVPQVGNKAIRQIVLPNGRYKNSKEGFLVDSNTANSSIMSKNALGEIQFAKYIKTKLVITEQGERYYVPNYQLYEHRGFSPDFEGELYVRIPLLGMDKKGNRLIEYSHSYNTEPQVTEEKVDTKEVDEIPTIIPQKESTDEVENDLDLSVFMPEYNENNLDNSEKSITFANVDNQLKELLKIDPKFMSRYGVLNESYIDTLTEEEKAIIIKDFCKK